MQAHQFGRRIVPGGERGHRNEHRDTDKQHRKDEEEGRYLPLRLGSFLHSVSSFLSSNSRYLDPRGEKTGIRSAGGSDGKKRNKPPVKIQAVF